MVVAHVVEAAESIPEAPHPLRTMKISSPPPTHTQDLMVKNIKRYQRQMKRDGGNPDEYDIIPATFVLPQVCTWGSALEVPWRIIRKKG